ncbi:MAG: MFS transporter, partial [Candidatus Zixiibacteriota bacterium]
PGFGVTWGGDLVEMVSCAIPQKPVCHPEEQSDEGYAFAPRDGQAWNTRCFSPSRPASFAGGEGWGEGGTRRLPTRRHMQLNPFRQYPNPRAVASWCFYDLANSVYVAVIPATVWSAYYSGVIAGGGGEGPLWWGRAVSVTMLFVALTSPVTGAIADLAGWRKRLLVLYTLLSVAATALLPTVGAGMVIYGFVLSIIAGIGFEGAMVFYNAYLPDLAPPDRQGRLSGLGFAVGYAGSFIGLLAALPLVMAGHYGPAFLLVAFLFLAFSIPSFTFLPSDRPATHSITTAARLGFSGAVATARDILRIPPLRRFLLGYLLYEDGVNTIIFFSSIFASQTLGFTMTQLIGVYIVVQLTALAGAVLWSRPTDSMGPKRVVLLMIAQWVIVVGLMQFVESQTTFFILAALAGLGLGAIQSASRAFMASMIPKGREGEFFGFYSLCGKSSAVLGPLVFGAIASQTGGDLRTAALSVIVFFILGGTILLGVRAGDPVAATRDGETPVEPIG